MTPAHIRIMVAVAMFAAQHLLLGIRNGGLKGMHIPKRTGCRRPLSMGSRRIPIGAVAAKSVTPHNRLLAAGRSCCGDSSEGGAEPLRRHPTAETVETRHETGSLPALSKT